MWFMFISCIVNCIVCVCHGNNFCLMPMCLSLEKAMVNLDSYHNLYTKRILEPFIYLSFIHSLIHSFNDILNHLFNEFFSTFLTLLMDTLEWGGGGGITKKCSGLLTGIDLKQTAHQSGRHLHHCATPKSFQLNIYCYSYTKEFNLNIYTSVKNVLLVCLFVYLLVVDVLPVLNT